MCLQSTAASVLYSFYLQFSMMIATWKLEQMVRYHITIVAAEAFNTFNISALFQKQCICAEHDGDSAY